MRLPGRSSQKNRPLIAAGMLLALSAAGWAAGTNYVAPGGSSTSPYDTWAKAATSIHWAVGYACSNLATYDTVMVSNGTYGIANGIFITNGARVVSLKGRDTTIINGYDLNLALT